MGTGVVSTPNIEEASERLVLAPIKCVFVEPRPTQVFLAFLNPTLGSQTFHHLSHFRPTCWAETRQACVSSERECVPAPRWRHFPLVIQEEAASCEVAYHRRRFIAIHFSVTPHWTRLNPITKDGSV